MNEIRWELLNRATENLAKCSLCVGEVKTLSVEEIQEVNRLLDKIAVVSEVLKNVNNTAKKRFRSK